MHFSCLIRSIALLLLVAPGTLASAGSTKKTSPTDRFTVFDNPITGYLNEPRITRHLGPGSPYFSLAVNGSDRTPPGCSVTFANILSRHGARFPTKGASQLMKAALAKTQLASKNSSVTLPPDFAFLRNFTYTLGQDNLTYFGQRELFNSGIKFFARYGSLSNVSTPFMRASGSPRVIQSAQNFTQGFNCAARIGGTISNLIPENSFLVIPEATTSNNTLHVGNCNAVSVAPLNTTGDVADQTWTKIFAPPITARLNANLPGANLNDNDTASLMAFCPYETVATPNGAISPFCHLFTHDEWISYAFLQDLDKFFTNGAGNKLGPSQGVGFVNELLARMTNTAVIDHTSTNATLDSSKATFPLGLPLYADFSHDTQITSILFALGFFNTTDPKHELDPTNRDSGRRIRYSSSNTVPFSGRVYFEKMRCDDNQEEMVRILINDAVQHLPFCGGDHHGRCTLSKFVESQDFARSGGLWTEC